MEFGVALFAALVILLIPPSWQKDPYIDVPFRDNEVPLEPQYYRKCRASYNLHAAHLFDVKWLY